MSYFFYIFQKKIFLTMGPKKVSDKPKGSRKWLTIEQKKNADIVDKIVSLGKALYLEVNEDVVELVEEHSKDLTTEDLEELKKQLNQERDKEDKECSSEGGGQQ